jgi:Transport and Golgi organisation 2
MQCIPGRRRADGRARNRDDAGVCTVVVGWSAGRPAQILALRDELTTREFDDPDRWWPEFPDVVGGRDRTAGGTWCATRIATGTTALVLNRPQKRVADPGAASRGLLPLLGVTYGADWISRIALPGMASFALVLVTPDRLTSWVFDGERLTTAELPEGTHMVTSGGPEDLKADRWLAGFAHDGFPDGWRGEVQARTPADDPSALVVRHEAEGRVYATVFGELIEAVPGRLLLEYTREPWTDAPWTRAVLS